MPGRTVPVLKSITLASRGIWMLAPTSVIRSPLIRMTWLFNRLPDLESNNRPARIATTWLGGVMYLRSCECVEVRHKATIATIKIVNFAGKRMIRSSPARLGSYIPGVTNSQTFPAGDIIFGDGGL